MRMCMCLSINFCFYDGECASVCIHMRIILGVCLCTYSQYMHDFHTCM